MPQIANIEWLGPPKSAQQKLSQSDFNKRQEIFHEFLYYLFDSILIPLIRANFHVTESNVHRYRLFFFRHDMWRSLAEPAIASLKITMFQEIKLEQAQKILGSRTLGFSQVRLLPKQTGVRPIMNLRRRPVMKGTNFLGSSINSVLAPVYNALTFEKVCIPYYGLQALLTPLDVGPSPSGISSLLGRRLIRKIENLQVQHP